MNMPRMLTAEEIKLRRENMPQLPSADSQDYLDRQMQTQKLDELMQMGSGKKNKKVSPWMHMLQQMKGE